MSIFRLTVPAIAELCKGMTETQFRLAIYPLIRCLLRLTGTDRPDLVVDLLEAVFLHLNLDPIEVCRKPTIDELELIDALWRSDKKAALDSFGRSDSACPPLNPEDLERLEEAFVQMRLLFDGFEVTQDPRSYSR